MGHILMNNIQAYLEKYPKETQRLLGINDEQLQQILVESRKYYAELQEIKERNKVRIIKSGGGRKPSLS